VVTDDRTDADKYLYPMATDDVCLLEPRIPLRFPGDADEMTMAAGTIKRIHVNQHIIRDNKKQNLRVPPLTIKWRNKTYAAKSVDIRGASQVVYSPDSPLSCGAHVWVETKAEVIAYR
jgi:hypothetical protein